MIRKIKQNSPCPNHCRHGDRFRRFMKTWDTHQIARWYECCVSVEPSAACEAQAQKRPAGPIVSRSPTSFVFNDVVGLDLFFLNTYEKHTLPAMNIACWGTGLQRVILLRDQSGETLRNAHRNNLVAVIRKASHPRCRSAAQPVLRHFRGKSGKRWDETRSDTAGGTVEEWQDRTCGQGLEGRLLQDDTRRP